MIRRCLLLSTDKLHFPRYAFSELFPVVADTLVNNFLKLFPYKEVLCSERSIHRGVRQTVRNRGVYQEGGEALLGTDR